MNDAAAFSYGEDLVGLDVQKALDLDSIGALCSTARARCRMPSMM